MYTHGVDYSYRPYSNQQTFIPEQIADPTSPEAFKQNLQLTQDNIARLLALTRRALAGIMHIMLEVILLKHKVIPVLFLAQWHLELIQETSKGDINSVKQTLANLSEIMKQSGIGALPLLFPDASGNINAPTDLQLMEKSARGVKLDFERLKRAQDSAAVVANLLGSEHRQK